MKSGLQYCLAILFLLAFLFRVDGQITITKDNFLRASTFTDSTYSSLIDESFPNPTIGALQIWDYSNLFVDSLYIRDLFDGSNDTDFPDAHNVFEDDRIFQSFIIPTKSFEGIDDIGWYPLGKANEDISYSIAGITGSASDLLRFPSVNDVHEGRLTYVKFPTNFGDKWENEYIEKTHFELSVAGFGLSKTPGLYKNRVSNHRSVEGYGQIILPAINGYESVPIDVLLIKSINTIVDSTFLGGAPAPAALMGAFGLIQGNVTIETSYIFYTVGFGAPVMSVEEGASQIYYRPQANRSISTSIKESLTYHATQFPNPVAKGQVLSIALNHHIEKVTVDFIDLSGRKVHSDSQITIGGNNIEIKLPNSMTSGLYFYKIRKGNSQIITSGKILVD